MEVLHNRGIIIWQFCGPNLEEEAVREPKHLGRHGTEESWATFHQCTFARISRRKSDTQPWHNTM